MGKVDKPRLPKPAFSYFLQECRRQHRQEHPNVHVNHDEFETKCFQRWTQMSREERDPYHQMAKKDRKRFQRSTVAYLRSKYQNKLEKKIEKMKNILKKSEESEKNFPRQNLRKQDPFWPQRDSSAYIYYANDQQSIIETENPSITFGEILGELQRRWKECSEDEKDKYRELASKNRGRCKKLMDVFRAGQLRKDEERYTYEDKDGSNENKDPSNEIEKYATRKEDEDNTDKGEEGRFIKSSHNSVESNIVEIKKPRRYKSAFNYFMQEFRQQHKHYSGERGEWMQKCSQRWKQMSHEERGPFCQMYIEDRKRYLREMAAYLRSNNGKNEKAKESKRKIPKQSSRKKDPLAPKRELSAYLYFKNDQRLILRAENPAFSLSEILEEIKSRWKSLSEDQRAKYKELESKDRERYKKEMQAYRAGKSRRVDENKIDEYADSDQDNEGVRDGDEENQRNQNEDDDNDVIYVSDS